VARIALFFDAPKNTRDRFLDGRGALIVFSAAALFALLMIWIRLAGSSH
jgi:hypothetical protein